MIAKADLAGTAGLITAATTFLTFMIAQALQWTRNRRAKAALLAAGVSQKTAVEGFVELDRRRQEAMTQMQDQINTLREQHANCERERLKDRLEWTNERKVLVDQIQKAAEDLRNWFPRRP